MSDTHMGDEAKQCSFVYELDDCDFEDSWPRPGDPCTNDADEGCANHRCEMHCSCGVHPGQQLEWHDELGGWTVPV